MSAPESTCDIDNTYTGSLTSADIVGDQAIAYESKGNLDILGVVRFASATAASGSLSLSYRDTATTPSCSGRSTLAFGATRQ